MTESKRPLVSIAVPTYNRADSYLKESLKSAVNQTYQNIEIIVSDNCSTDTTEMVVKAFNDNRIRYFRQKENIGAVPNSNYCLDRAKGVYFTQLHDDNLIDNDFLETCLKAVNYSSNIGVIRAGTRWIDSQGNVIREYPNMATGLSTDAYFRAYFAGKAAMYLCSTLFNTERVREIGGFRSRYNLLEDVMADVKIATRYGRHDIQEIKASFRKHDSAMTLGVTTSHWCGESLALIDLMCDLASENKDLVRVEGMRAMANFNYKLVSNIKSSLKRFIAYLIVFKQFKYRYLPPPLRRLIYNNPLYIGARHIKRSLMASSPKNRPFSE